MQWEQLSDRSGVSCIVHITDGNTTSEERTAILEVVKLTEKEFVYYAPDNEDPEWSSTSYLSK